MKKFLLMFLTIFLFSTYCYGKTPKVAPLLSVGNFSSSTFQPARKGKVSPIKKGQKSPFSGIVYDIEANAWILTQLKNFEKRLKLTKEATLTECNLIKNAQLRDQQITFEASIKTQKASLDEQARRIKILTKLLQDEENKKNLEPLLWAGGGVISGIALTLVTVLLIVL